MLPRRLRLARRAFPLKGARDGSPHFSLLSGPSGAGGASAVVSKKVARRAVARNLLRRRMLSVLRPYALPGRYLVVYARGGSAELSYAELSAELSGLLARATGRRA